MSGIPYVTFKDFDEFLKEIERFATADGGSDIDGNVVRITGLKTETGSRFTDGLLTVTAGFRALDDFFVFEAPVDSRTAGELAVKLGEKCASLGLKVFGGRFRL